MKNLLYYSTNAELAKIITEKFFNGIFRVWCAPMFDNEHNPPSSNPKDIFLRLHKDVKKMDNHCSKMREIKAGLEKAIMNKKQSGEITEQQAIDALDMVGAADISYFKPLLYLIPNSSEINLISAKIEDKSGLLSEEYIINNLKAQTFDIIHS